MDSGNYIYVFLRYFKRSATELSLVIDAALVIGHCRYACHWSLVDYLKIFKTRATQLNLALNDPMTN
jgi:hypothetical protein